MGWGFVLAPPPFIHLLYYLSKYEYQPISLPLVSKFMQQSKRGVVGGGGRWPHHSHKGAVVTPAQYLDLTFFSRCIAPRPLPVLPCPPSIQWHPLCVVAFLLCPETLRHCRGWGGGREEGGGGIFAPRSCQEKWEVIRVPVRPELSCVFPFWEVTCVRPKVTYLQGRLDDGCMLGFLIPLIFLMTEVHTTFDSARSNLF